MTKTDAATGQDDNGRVKDGLENARATASQATARAGEALETNPLAVLAGGLALGAIAGALVPRSEREKELLRPIGSKIGATAAAAIAAAKEASRTELENRGLTATQARDQVKTLFQSVGQAATTAATAAVKSAKQEATGAQGGQQPDSTGGTGDVVPPINPHQQVMAGDRETSFNPTV